MKKVLLTSAAVVAAAAALTQLQFMHMATGQDGMVVQETQHTTMV